MNLKQIFSFKKSESASTENFPAQAPTKSEPSSATDSMTDSSPPKGAAQTAPVKPFEVTAKPKQNLDVKAMMGTVTNISRRLPKYSMAGQTAMYVAVAFALTLAALAAYQAEQTVARIKVHAVESSVSKTVLSGAPVSDTDYQKLATSLKRLHPDLDFEGGKGSLVVSSKEAENYGEWIYAMTSIPAVDATIRWDVSELCLGENCQESAAIYAKLVGQRTKIEKK